MKRLLFFVLATAALGLFSACNKDILFENTSTFRTESFDNFLWKKHIPDTVKAYIDTDFEECVDLTKPLVLYLCNDDAEPIPASVAQLYVNGVPSPDNTISIIPADNVKRTEIWIVLDDSQTHIDRTFTWNLQIKDNPGLLRVNETVPGKTPWIPDTTINWQNNHIANSLEVTFWTLLGILAGILLAVIILCRLNNPAFKVSRLFLTGETMKTVPLRGVGRVILTDKKQSQSFFNELFFRKTVFVKNDFFSTGDVEITPKFRIQTDSGKRNGVRISGRSYSISSNIIAKDDSADLVNIETQQTVNIKVQ